MSALGSLVVSLALEHAQFTKGLDKSSQEALKFAKNTQDSFDKAGRATKNYVEGVVGGAVAAGAAYLSVNAIISTLKSSIDQLDSMNDISKKTGLTVESLGAWSLAAEKSGTSIDSIAAALAKTSKYMVEHNDNLKALGIEGKTSEEVMLKLSGAIAKLPSDDPRRVALAIEVMGKSAAELLPLLSEGEQGLKAMLERGKELSPVTQELAEKADLFNDNLAELKVASSALSISFLGNLLPSMTETTQEMTRMQSEGNSLLAILRGIAGIGKLPFDFLFDSKIMVDSKTRIHEIEQSISDLKKNLKEVETGGLLQKTLFGSKNEINQQITILQNQLDAFKKFGEKIDNPAKQIGIDAKKSTAEVDLLKTQIDELLAGGSSDKARDAADKARDAALKQQTAAYQSVIEKVHQYTAAQAMDASQTEKITAGQKTALEIMVQIRDGKLKLTTVQKENLALALKEMLTQEENTAADNLRIESQKAFTAGLLEARQAVMTMVEAEQANLDKTNEQINLMLLGKNGIDDLAIARLEETAAAYEQNIVYAKQNGIAQENIDYLEKQAEAFRTLAELRKKSSEANANLDALNVSKKNADDAIAESKRTAEQILKDQQDMAKNIQHSLSDALLRGFESGKGFARNFIDTLKNMFKTLVLQPVINMIVSPISGAMTAAIGAAGLSGTAQAAGAAGSIGNGLSMSGMYNGMMNGFQSLTTSFNSSVMNAGSWLVDNGFGKLGSAIWENSSAITNGLAYTGAIISALRGDFKGAAIQGAATLIGSMTPLGPIGGALIGGVVSSIAGMFGGTPKLPRYYTAVKSTYSDGQFTAGKGYTGSDSHGVIAGTEKPLQDLAKAWSESMAKVFKATGTALELQITDVIYKKNNSFGRFNYTLNGVTTKTTVDSGDDVNKTFQDLVSKSLSSTFVKAITESSLPKDIKNLFDGLLDGVAKDKKIEVTQGLVNSLANLSNASDQLNTRWGMTVVEAAKVADASGLTGQALVDFTNSIANMGNALKTAGALSQESKTALSTAFSIAVTEAGNSIKKYTLNSGEHLTRDLTFNEQFKSTNLPKTIAEYDDFIKALDTTTEAGAKAKAALIALEPSFIAFIASIDAVKTNVAGAVFSLKSPSDQLIEMQSALASDYAKYNNLDSAGNSIALTAESLINLGTHLDYTTAAGLDLANAFPTLVSEFLSTEEKAKSLAGTISDVAAAIATAEQILSKKADLNQNLAIAQANGDPVKLLQISRTKEFADLEVFLTGLDAVTHDTFINLQQSINDQIDANTALAASNALASQRAQLEIQLMQLTGNATGALAAQRAIELSSMDATLRGLQNQIYAQQDLAAAIDAAKTAASTAFNVLNEAVNLQKQAAQDSLDTQLKAIDAQKTATKTAYDAQVKTLTASMDMARKSADTIKAVSDSLKNILDSMQRSGTESISRIDAQAKISQALSIAKLTGVLPDLEKLAPALAAIQKPSEDMFATYQQYAIDFAKTQGDILALSNIAGAKSIGADSNVTAIQSQLDAAQSSYDKKIASFDTAAEAARARYDAAIKGFDLIINAAKTQLDVALGSNIAVMSVADAIQNLTSSIDALALLKNTTINTSGLTSLIVPTIDTTVQALPINNTVLSSSNSDAVVASNKELLTEIQGLRADNKSMAADLAKLKTVMVMATHDGYAMQTEVAA